MSSRRTSSRQRSASQQPAFPQLPIGIQTGLERLVIDHKKIVAQMLDVTMASSVTDPQEQTTLLCEKCATIMKQQQLSVSQFLTRFFDISMLQQHAETVLSNSGKGSAVVLSERIQAAWTKRKPFVLPALSEDNQKSVVQEVVNRSSDGNKDEVVNNRKRAATHLETPVETEPSTGTEKTKKPKASLRPLK